MATYLANLLTIRDNLCQELATETAYRVTNGPKPTYSIAGRSVSWMEYISGMQAAIKKANDDLIAAGGDGGIIEEVVVGYSR
jgi:hypothetical protein